MRIGITLLGLIVYWGWFGVLNYRPNPADHRPVDVLIPARSSAGDALVALKKAHLISHVWRLKLTIKLLGADHSLLAGSWQLTPDMPLWRIVRTLQGRTPGHPPRFQKVTITEGLTIPEIAVILDRKGIMRQEDFLAAVSHPTANEDLQSFSVVRHLPQDSLEGYLFPDTYIVSPGMLPIRLVKLMLHRFEQVMLPLMNRPEARTLSLHSVLTMASIVEKEAIVDKDRPVVASVFYNRLRAGMRLASCPTVKYALGEPRKGALYFKDLDVDSPFNTYRHTGLPPGPICNPGVRSIRAALFPSKTRYYYFAARGDDTNVFSENYAQHVAHLYSLGLLRRQAIAPTHPPSKDEEVEPGVEE